MEICELVIYADPIDAIDPTTFEKIRINNPVKRTLYMLDGKQDEKKPYSAVKVENLDGGRETKLTMHFTALNDEDARRFLKEGGYEGYKLILTEKL